MKLLKAQALVVDDNSMDRRIVTAILHSLRFKDVQEAENGIIAQGKIKTAEDINRPFELILLDWHMPNMGGLKLLESIRSHPHAKISKAKVIIMTSTADLEIVEAAIAAGATDFVVKPVTQEVLDPKIQKLGLT